MSATDAAFIREVMPTATILCWTVSFDPDAVSDSDRSIAAVDQLMVPSRAVIDAWSERSEVVGPDDFTVVTLWASEFFEVEPDAAGRRAARARFGLDADAPVVVYAGGHLAGKGGAVAEAALVQLAGDIPGLTLLSVGTVVGSGLAADHRQERTIGALRVIETVRLRPDSIRDAFRAADFGLVPTQIFETFGLAAVEMVLAGTVPIVSDHGGLPEIVGADDPLLVHRFRDADAWAEALRRGFAWSEEERADHLARLQDRVQAFTRASSMARWTDVARRLSHAVADGDGDGGGEGGG